MKGIVIMPYVKDGPFNDPVVRCDSCQALVLVEEIKVLGSCTSCGNRRVRNVQVMKPDEMADLRHRGVDEGFLVLFEEVSNLADTANRTWREDYDDAAATVEH